MVVFAGCFVSTLWICRLLALATVLAFILIIPLSIVAYDKGGTTAHWLKHSGQHRVEIWHFAAERALEKPLFGWGFNASRYVPNGDAVSHFLPPGQSLIPLHPHDAFLQVWLEIGAVGAVIVGGDIAGGAAGGLASGLPRLPDLHCRVMRQGWSSPDSPSVSGKAGGWRPWPSARWHIE